MGSNAVILVVFLVMLIIFLIPAAIVGIVFIVRAARRKRLPQQASTTDVTTGVRLYAYEFNGLYEALYQAAVSPGAVSYDAYYRWCDRVELLRDTDFQRLFRQEFPKSPAATDDEARQRFSKLLRYIFAAGFTRSGDAGTPVTVTSQNAKLYTDKSGRRPAPGATGSILKPAWCLGESVIEPGVIL